MNLPSRENVLSAVTAFDRENHAVESALTLLMKQYPHNRDLDQVVLKAVAVNALYSTQIPVYTDTVVNIIDVAQFIKERDMDVRLANGDPELIDELSSVKVDGKKVRKCFSFATKYCSWHNSDAYPIWDTNVYKYLRRLQQTGFRRDFRLGGDWKYIEFVNFMEALRREYNLGGVPFKDIDKFLYTEGPTLKVVQRRLDGYRRSRVSINSSMLTSSVG